METEPSGSRWIGREFPWILQKLRTGPLQLARNHPRTVIAATDGAFRMYIAEGVRISQYRISDILNRGLSVPGEGGALDNRFLRFAASTRRVTKSPQTSGHANYIAFTDLRPPEYRAPRIFCDIAKLGRN